MRIGSLFSGYGGLDAAVVSELGGEVVWHCDNDPAVGLVLAHHWPGVPNLGDITDVEWSAVPSVDVLTGGFPCEDVSSAGKRLGLRPDTRSGLWTQMSYAIAALRPSLVVIENVRGLASASAASDVEPCPWCMGNGRNPMVRALGAVLGDLADLGYDANWHGLHASDVGAPHARFRIFICAWPTWIDGSDSRFATDPDRNPIRVRSDDLTGSNGAPFIGRNHATPSDTEGDGRAEGRTEPAGLVRGPDASLGSAGIAPDPDSGQSRVTRSVTHPDDQGGGQHAMRSSVVAWGRYEPAIRLWELTLGRPAPEPTQLGKRGQRQLSPRFVEWMQGLPEGHVTAVQGLSRNDQLRVLGRGVVSRQAAAAISVMLSEKVREAS